jgi:ABC-type sugar transport system ATPase subunit
MQRLPCRDGWVAAHAADVHRFASAGSIGMVVQSYVLFPNISVLDDAAFPPRMRR